VVTLGRGCGREYRGVGVVVGIGGRVVVVGGDVTPPLPTAPLSTTPIVVRVMAPPLPIQSIDGLVVILILRKRMRQLMKRRR